MPPGSVFNWYCVAHSVADILANAARIRATQLASVARPVADRNDVDPEKAKQAAKRTVQVGAASPSLPTESLRDEAPSAPAAVAPAVTIASGQIIHTPEHEPVRIVQSISANDVKLSHITTGDFPAASPDQITTPEAPPGVAKSIRQGTTSDGVSHEASPMTGMAGPSVPTVAA
ncbi:uncharacterized protein LAESUDRAFT_555766 [Laetiporus sulphureus 93-53]|uniref:Uncharacterized protein n=1 Tax=Laetiporus sulphureus 93-53 TaxID=1314785 RepID=A0A165B6S9_9APHY|nr:uncharacterized protein LAESUDRAFT_555766 [Laetiporus sulphureus 93-53]KZT00372.1 hypothetical protein LAESUDRAFT_555766 [Laetiporus sulphureus 93-53]